MKKNHLILGLFLLFSAGVLTGAMTMRIYVHHRMRAVVTGGPDALRANMVRTISMDLKMTEKQRKHMDQCILGAQREIFSIRQEVQPRVMSVVLDCVARMNTELDPGQQQKLERKVQRIEQAWNKSSAKPDHP